MAAVTTELKVLVKAVGKGEVDKLSKSLNDLGSKAAAPANRQFRELSVELKKIQRNSTQSIANLRGYRNAWRDISEQVKIGSREFKVATENAKRLDAQLQKAQGRGRPTGFLGRIGGVRGAAKGVGAIAAGGVFGGPEGALGAGIGLAAGGPAGAAVGAAIGAQVGGIRQALGATAEYSANLDKLRIALKGVTTSSEEYQQGLSFVQESTERFAIPQEILTRQFTKLQASVQGAGGNLDDTKTAFNGIVAAVRATGGSLADVDAALTATAQVFSKGKVSAEELRQQIGERLPGAFTLFAESMGLTPAELDKALEQGKVSLQDFQGFAKAIFDRYGKNAEAIAKSPKAAGDQLQVQLQQLQESVGRLLQPIGAFFQKTFGAIVRDITRATNALARFLNLSFDPDKLAKAEAAVARETALIAGLREGPTKRRAEARLRKARQAVATQERLRDASAVDVQQPEAAGGFSPLDLEGGADGQKIKTTSAEILRLTEKRFEAFRDGNAEIAADFARQIAEQQALEDFNNKKIDANTKNVRILAAQEKFHKAILRLRQQAKNAETEYQAELTKTQQLVKNIALTFRDNMAQGISDVILKARSLGDVLGNVLRMAANLFIQFGVKTMFSAIPGFDKIIGSANGNVFYQNKVVPFARGGIVNQPTIFPMANGAGLMGEAGPEAIMPLRRGPSGRLGVEAAGGAGGNVVVNVDASGSAVQGDSNQAAQLGKAIGSAVQAELIKQKRPGGLLAGV
jgi:tape measure domain-containing protein